MNTKHTEVWSTDVNIRLVLRFTTMFTVLGYIGFLAYSLVEIDGTPSVSAMIELSRGTAITFGILTLVHSYTVASYLVIASHYIGHKSAQYWLIAGSSGGYILALVMVTYLPSSTHEGSHNAVAFVAFFFAILSSILHKHGALVSPGETALVITEAVFILTMIVLGAVFWFADVIAAEYIFVLLVIVDKEFKVMVLERWDLLNVDDSRLRYTYRVANEGIMSDF